MHIPLDRRSDQPLYQQIEGFLRSAIQSGLLAPETRLPATRALARDLGVNRITVEAAYAALEADGLVYSRQGSGTYILASAPALAPPSSERGGEWPLWQQEIQARRQAAAVRPDGGCRVSAHAHPVDFSGGFGDTHLFPVEDFRKVIQKVLRRDGVRALETGEPNGYGPLRATIAQVVAGQGIAVRPENILVTAGSQQALALVARLLVRPGEAVLVESPTYAGALNLFRAIDAQVVGVPVDARGMQVEKLEKLLQRHHPRLIYTIPNFQNPTGTSLSSPRRRLLLDLADRYNVPILEDDFVGDLRYEGRTQPALKSLDPGGRVIYVSTFSKMLMPGMRVGFLAAEGPVYDSLVETKRVNDLATSNLYQRALEAYVTVGRYQAHLRRSCTLYRQRRDAMLRAMDRYLPAGVQVSPPQGGLFIWLRLPDGLSAEALLPLACEEGVIVSPGSLFFPGGEGGQDYLRLNFAALPPEEIDAGIQRLGKAMRRARGG